LLCSGPLASSWDANRPSARGKSLMHEANGHRALSDGRGDSLDRSGMDVADGEDPGLAGLEEERPLVAVGREVLALDVAAREQDAVLIHRDMTGDPIGVRGCTDEHEQRLRLELARAAG